MTRPSPVGSSNWPDCASRLTLDVISGKWVLPVLEILADGPQRYSRLEQDIPVAGSMLTRTLRRMERDGVLTRDVEPTVPPRVEYRPTPLGATLRDPLAALATWADHHGGDVEAARRDYDRRADS